jgi:lysozyme family protein
MGEIMTVSFEQAIQIVLTNEGGYTNDPNDAGGETNYGITWYDLNRAVNKGIVPHGTNIVGLLKSQAIIIYKNEYWDVLNLDRLETQSIANKILDTCVNIGNAWGITCLQRALKATPNPVTLEEDGVLGGKTIETVNASLPAYLLTAYRSEVAGYHRSIVISKPSQKIFLEGWLERSYQ